MRDHYQARRDSEGTSANRSGPAPGRQSLTSRMAGTPVIQAHAATAGLLPAPASACEPAPDLSAVLDAAVRPDLASAARPVQLRAGVVAGAPDASASTDASESSGGTGAPLPGSLRAQMERSLGADFSSVRVREDASATALGADAYARGDDITFAPGHYDASSTAGRELIGHELVHVVQQRQGRVAATTQARGGTAVNADPGLEREADDLGARAARGEIVSLGGGERGGGGGGHTAQLRPGKVQRGGVRVHLETGDVELAPGTQVDVEGTTVTILSGAHKGKAGTLLGSGEDAFLFAPERDEEIGSDHVIYPNCSTGFIGLPEAVAVDGSDVVVHVLMQTRNLYDRVKFVIGFQHPDTPEKAGGEPVGIGVRDIDARNPAWSTGGAPIGHPAYEFSSGFTSLPGTAEPSALRLVVVRIPIRRIRAYYQEKLKRWTDTGICIQLGIDMFYGGKGPSVATEDERGKAYPKYDPRGHQYGFGATSSPQSLGRVTFSSAVQKELGIGTGQRQSPQEYGEQPLGENPPNSLESPFPFDYPEQNPSFLPLVPARFLERDDHDEPRLGLDRHNTEMQLKLQTRIENEATLKVSSLESLRAMVTCLTEMGKEGDVTHLMTGGDPLLRQFTWRLEKKKPMVFTDVYLDDDAFHALGAGLGIRKRRSKEAAKLNVKTGAGYNVKGPKGSLQKDQPYPEDREHGVGTDIYRRHEIGFSIDPEASPEQIGAFLQSGVDGGDPWNLGAQQSNLGLDEEHQVDFRHLREQMVLIGDRTKFNLQATPLSGKGVINIEISCDHTVGCRKEDWNIDPNQEGFDFKTWHAKRDTKKFPETFNVEMELEHLGAGGSTESKSTGSKKEESEPVHGTMWGLPSQIKKQVQEEKKPRLGVPPGFPERRPYTKEDSKSSAFDTPSFSVFYAAHQRVIELLHGNIELPKGELGPDVQKLEAIRDKLGLLGERKEEPRDEHVEPIVIRRPQPQLPQPETRKEPTIESKHPTESKQPIESKQPEVLNLERMSLFDFNKRYRKGTGDGEGLNCLLDSLCQVAPGETQHAFGGDSRKATVDNMRLALIEAGYTKFKRKLDIASAEEGQAILAQLNIDVIVFIEVQGGLSPLRLGRSGGNPRHLHFKGDHYSPVFPK